MYTWGNNETVERLNDLIAFNKVADGDAVSIPIMCLYQRYLKPAEYNKFADSVKRGRQAHLSGYTLTKTLVKKGKPITLPSDALAWLKHELNDGSLCIY